MEKKEYIAPKIEVVKFEAQTAILYSSLLGLAPTSYNSKDLA